MSVYEIAIEGQPCDLEFIETFLTRAIIPYYIEPPSRYSSLDDLEAACEGK